MSVFQNKNKKNAKNKQNKTKKQQKKGPKFIVHSQDGDQVH